MKERKLVSARAYARLRGVSHTAVLRAIKAGRLVTVDGKLDPAAADKAWAANTDPTKPANVVSVIAAGTGNGDASRIRDSSNGVAASYATSRAIREQFNARLAKLEYEERSAQLVRADEVRIATFNVARSARNQLLALPDRLAPILAAIASTREVHNLLTVEVRRVCEELSADADPDNADR